jgi:hypothetical protein
VAEEDMESRREITGTDLIAELFQTAEILDLAGYPCMISG